MKHTAWAVLLIIVSSLVLPLIPHNQAQAQTTYARVAYLTRGNMAEDWGGDGSTLAAEPSLAYLTDLVGPAIKPTSTADMTIVDLYGGALADWTNVEAACDNYSINSLPYMYMSATDLETIATANLLDELSDNITAFLVLYDLDGISLNIEGGTAKTAASTLIGYLYTSLNPLGKVIDWCGFGYQYVAGDVLLPNLNLTDEAKIRYIHVMCYDLWTYPDQTSGYPHSTIADSETAIEAWVTAGFTKSKILMGIPFYGRSPGGASSMNYDDIYDAIAPSAATDYGLVSGTLYWWGGPDTDTEKAAYVKDNGFGGVMVFALGYDKLNTSASLLLAIYEELIGEYVPPTSTPTTTPPVLPTPTPTVAPDATAPSVKSFNVYRTLLESNDYLLVGYANIPYDTPPDDLVSETFIWNLYDDNNTSLYGYTYMYAYHDNGYGYNVFAFYFDNSTAPTWEEDCFVRLVGNPAYFSAPPSYAWQLADTNYTSETTQALNRAALAALIIDISSDIAQRWGLDASTFLYEGETGTFLSAAGQAFWRGAIYGLQGLCPNVFPYNVETITITDRTWESTYTDNLTSQWSGTWVEDAQNAGKALFDIDYDMGSILLVMGLVVGVLVGNIMLASDTWGGLMDSSIILIAMAKLGLFTIVFLGFLAAIAVVYVAIKVWGIGR